MNVSTLDIIHNISFVGWAVVLISFLLTLFSGIIFWQDVTKRSNRFFFFFGAIIGVWGLAYAFFEGTLGTPLVHQSIIVLYLVSGLVPLFTFIYLYVFSTEKTPFSFWKFVGLFSSYLTISATLILPDFVVGYQDALGGEAGRIIFGKGYLLYAMYVCGFLVAGVYILVQKYRESAGIFKIVIRDLLIALSFGFLVVVSIEVLFPLLSGGSNLFWVGHLSVVTFGITTSVILARYNFWSIKVVMTEFFISIVIFILIIELFLANSILDLFIKTAILLFIVLSSSFLAGSLQREIESKEKITRLLRDLEFLSKQFKILDRKKSEFLAISSHHLRDPLTAINGYASMLMEGSFGEISPALHSALEKIFESSKRLITMVSDFLDISRIESGHMKYNFEEVDMKKIVVEVGDEMKLNAQHAGLVFNMDIKEGEYGKETFFTIGDAGKLRQVISNLIDNSIKYTPHGEVMISLEKSADRKKIIFSITDTGIGMSKETIGKIFKKFSRADGVSKLYTEGTGLGLYVAKEIMKKHEGRIWADSKGEGVGSSFHLELEVKL